MGTGLFREEGPEEPEVGAQTSVPEEKRKQDNALGLVQVCRLRSGLKCVNTPEATPWLSSFWEFCLGLLYVGL